MLGMDMMMKNMLGIDPSELGPMIEKAKSEGVELLTSLFSKLNEIQQSQAAMHAKVDRLLAMHEEKSDDNDQQN